MNAVRPAPDRPAAAPDAPPALPVLVVDDHPASLQAIAAVLEPLGSEVVCASSGEEALRHLLARAFAVIVMDVRMPRLDGFATTRLLRRHPTARHTPVIFVTGQDASALASAEAYAVGAVDYIMKPIVPAVLRSKVAVFVELARQAEVVRRQATELAAINRELESFSYSVSHDLRAPLRAITGFSDIVLEDYRERLDADGRDALQRIRDAAGRLDHLIEGLLALARVTQVPLHVQPVDLSAAAQAVLDELRAAEPARVVDATVAPGLTASGDGSLLRLVLQNLLQNAWKYTRRRSRARIEFGAETRDGVRAFFVRDDGVGFDPGLADELFRPFTRLHPASAFEGTGIGLATVQRVIARHGGRVWFEAAQDRGATFWFTLR